MYIWNLEQVLLMREEITNVIHREGMEIQI